MKDFLKMTLAVVVGTLLVSVITMILMFGIIGSLSLAGSTHSPVPAEGVLKIDLSKVVINEQMTETIQLQSLAAGDGMVPPESIGLWDATRAIDAAASDPAVKFIYLKTDGNTSGIGSLYELRAALERFRNVSGKAIVSYVEAPGTGSYYMASVADKIYMTPHPGATIPMTGMNAQLMFFGDVLKNLGVNVQLIRHGKYKSAGEMYTRGSASPENREQYQVMINSCWDAVAGQIAASRSISVDDLNAAIDGLKLCMPQDFVDCSLVDELLDRQELEKKLATLAVKDDFKYVKFINFADYVAARTVPTKIKEKIAVIYADGEIVDGSFETEVSGDRFAALVEKVRADSTVKAVVLRVNSPGGSVLASDKIKAELDRLQQVKPLVASYGDVAASGGYWISACADKIYSDAVTLTGSIGVFGMIPDLSGAAGKLKLGVENIGSHKHSDMLGLMRPLDKDETAYMQRSIEDIYDRFTTLVADGRSMSKEAVDNIAQGRVWAGNDALRIGLVDEIGTLDDAVRYAAAAAGNPDLAAWNVKGYPEPKNEFQMLMQSLEGIQPDYSVLADSFKDFTQMKIVARLPYEVRVK